MSHEDHDSGTEAINEPGPERFARSEEPTERHQSIDAASEPAVAHSGSPLTRVLFGIVALVVLSFVGNWVVRKVLNVGEFEVGKCYDGAKLVGANRADEVPCDSAGFRSFKALAKGTESELERSPFCRVADVIVTNGDDSFCFGDTSAPAESEQSARGDAQAPAAPRAPASTEQPAAFGAWNDRLEQAWADRDEAALAGIVSPQALTALRAFVTGDSIAIDLTTPCLLGSSGNGACEIFVRPDPDQPSGLPFYFEVREVDGEIYVTDAVNEGD